MKRYALSNWRIRTRLTALLVLPVIAAIVLGGFRIQASLQTQQQLSKVTTLGAIATAATDLATALENERDLAAGVVTATGQIEDDQLVHATKNTDTKLTSFTTQILALNQADLPAGGADLTTVQSTLGSLTAVRTHAFVNTKSGGSLSSINAYENMIQPLLSLSQNLALVSANQELITATRALQEFSKWKDYQSVVRAVISANLATKQPIGDADRQYAAQASRNAGGSQDIFNRFYGTARAQGLYGAWTNNINIIRTKKFTASVVAATQGWGVAGDPPNYTDWDVMATSQITEMTSDEGILVQQLNTLVTQLSSQARTDAIVNAVLIALVLLVAVLGAAMVARSMVRTLSKLQAAAEDVAEHRLPELVRTLSESDPQDVDTSVAPIGINTTDEIGHVARAFDQVHTQAVRLAAEQALLRGNINAMFTNLSRRSQGLIQRQLSMISELESREADPDQLASLFKLDHLATRMRRNGENLLVLAGEDPGRRWTRPVPLVDVLRAAASEVEQYERIELASVPTADVAGRVVNDLVHLLAELLENATSFSSPQTRVRVTGHALPDGRVLVEIHDTGIGLSPDDLAEINERLANPPVVDVAVSRRMGLFVVGRLSLRHGIRIQLRPSDSGGTTALVMLPVDVTNAAERRGGAQGPGQQRPQGGQPGGPQGAAGSPQGAPQGAPQVRGPQQRGAMPQGPGRTPINSGPAGAQQAGGPGARPSLPPQAPEQPGLPRRGAQGLPTGSSPMGGLTGGPQPSRRPQQPAPTGPQGQQQGQQQGQLGLQGPGQQQGPQQGQRPPQHSPAGGPPDDRALWAEQPQHGGGHGNPGGMDSTAQFARPHFDEEPARPVPPQQQPPQQQPPQQQRPMAPQPVAPQAFAPQQPPVQQQPVQQPAPQQPMALPAAGSQQDVANHPLTRALPPAEAGAGSSPIFEAMESNWFRSGRADRMRAVQVYGDSLAAEATAGSAPAAPTAPTRSQPYQPQRPQSAAAPAPTGGAPFGTPPQRPLPQRGVAGGVPTGSTGGAAQADPWRASANDEVWRRAEQVREPSAGGVLPSGLPRRVPKANLVPGTAESAPAEGPAVSRSPEEVRGRLTNLRRGIQQGRQAGTTQGSTNEGSPNNGPYGTNPQER